MRIHVLAKELGIENKVLVEFLQKQGADVKSHMSSCPDNMIDLVREKFGKKETPQTAQADKPEIKVVAVPDFIAKEEPKTVPTRTADGEKIEDGGKQIAKVEAKKAAEAKSKEPEEPKKKKKIIAVFNPQHSNSEKGRAMARAQRDEQRRSQEKPKRPLPSQVRPARDRKPSDEEVVKRPLPSQIRPAKDRIPDDELAEMKAKALAEQEQAAAKEQEAAKETVKPQETVEAPKEETPKEQVQPAAAETAKEPVKAKESEAVKSLREKIVKGTVSVEDIQVSRPSKDKNKDRQRQQNAGQNKGQGANKGGQNQKQGGGKPAQNQPAADSKGKGKGGKQRHNDKQHGDKFDRLENEKAAQRQQKQAEENKEEEIKVITLPETISVKDFAAKLKMQPSALIKKMFLAGQILTVNDTLDFETAESICLDMDILVEHEVEIDYIEELLKEVTPLGVVR